MNDILWLSGLDVEKTGVCRLEETVKIVEKTFLLFDRGEAIIAPETALRLDSGGQDQACYALPAYVGDELPICGLKWTSHGKTAVEGKSRIQASIVINDIACGVPLALMNGTEIGAARTGAVTALALTHLAPKNPHKVALCGAGGEAESQLRAILLALSEIKEIAVWSRGNERNHRLAEKYNTATEPYIHAVASLEEATEGADIIIAVTSAAAPYLTSKHLKTASLYCHIGFHEIAWEAVNMFRYVVADTWEEAKNVSGQSLFRYYREGKFKEERVTGTLGGIISKQIKIPRGTPENKVFFDAFGLPIFDLSVAREAYIRAKYLKVGAQISW